MNLDSSSSSNLVTRFWLHNVTVNFFYNDFPTQAKFLDKILYFFLISSLVAFKGAFLAHASVNETVVTEYTQEDPHGNCTTTNEFENLINQLKREHTSPVIIQVYREAAKLVCDDIVYRHGGKNNPNTGLDCTGVICYLFNTLKMPFHYEQMSTSFMTHDHSNDFFADFTDIKKNPNGSFSPHYGDLLVYHNGREGHVVMVVDPKNCIAFNSTSYAAKDGPKLNGVQFHRIFAPQRCLNGDWKYWDITNTAHQFDRLLRPNAYQDDRNIQWAQAAEKSRIRKKSDNNFDVSHIVSLNPSEIAKYSNAESNQAKTESMIRKGSHPRNLMFGYKSNVKKVLGLK